MPIIVFSIREPGAIAAVLDGKGRATFVGEVTAGRSTNGIGAKKDRRHARKPWHTNDTISKLKRRMQGALTSLKTELSGLRTAAPRRVWSSRAGRRLWHAHALISSRRQPFPSAQLSVQVWDRSMVHAVEKGISAAISG